MSHSNQTNSPSMIGDTLLQIIRQAVREEIGQVGSKQKTTTEDRLLTAEGAAEMLSVSPDWLYRHGKKLPFRRKLGPKMLRFSQLGMLKWLETRKVN
jgi:predicted DNA-binding transcriptional regulator AlpA